MDERALVSESYELIKKDFQLDESFDAEVDKPLDRLHSFLTQVVNHMLDKDFNRLMNALYRIDVSEEKVKQILALSEPDSLAKELADLIIERELKKVEIRRKYRR